MPDNFFVPRNLLKALQEEPQGGTMDLTVDDQVHFHGSTSERSRITTLRDLVTQTLAWDEEARQRLAVEIDKLGRDVERALETLGSAHPGAGADQALLEHTIEAYRWIQDGLGQMRLFLEMQGEERLVEGMGLIEQAVRRVDELLSPSTMDLGAGSTGTDIRL